MAFVPGMLKAAGVWRLPCVERVVDHRNYRVDGGVAGQIDDVLWRDIHLEVASQKCSSG